MLDLVLRDVDGCQQVLLDDALGDDDAVLVVVTLPGHVGHGEIGSQGEFSVVDGGAVCESLAHLDLLA